MAPIAPRSAITPKPSLIQSTLSSQFTPAAGSGPNMQMHSITASVPASAPDAVGASGPASGPASTSFGAVLEHAAASSGVPSALASLIAAGGSEALQHLLTLGMGTLMAAATLRHQGHGADTLAAAQLQTASHPSSQALLSMIISGQRAALQGAPGPQSSPVQTNLHQHACDIPHLGNRNLAGDDSPLGSMSDLMALCDSTGFGELERVTGGLCLGLGFGGRSCVPDHAGLDEAIMQHEGTDPNSPMLGQLLSSDQTLHQFMQPCINEGSSPNLMSLLDGLADGDISMLVSSASPQT